MSQAENKELRRLKRRELLQMLLIQCEETERLQQETDEMRAQMKTVMESYGRLKKKLDIKDERLNQKDAKIRELTHEIEELKTAGQSAFESEGTAAEAAYRLSELIEEVQKAAEQYMANIRKYPFGTGRTDNVRKRQGAPGAGQVVPMSFSQADREKRRAVSGDFYG